MISNTDSLLKYSAATPIKKSNKLKVKSKHDPLYRDIRTGEEILDIILPPREFEGQKPLEYYMQKVLRAPATEREIEKLRYDLDRKLFERGARMSGPCTIRRELYSQALDELIRLETIACAETGILLAAWRDHTTRNLTAYEELYLSRLTNENEKFLRLEQKKLDLRDEIKRLNKEEKELELELMKMDAQMQHARLCREEKANNNTRSYKEGIEHLSESTDEAMKELKSKLKKLKTGM